MAVVPAVWVAQLVRLRPVVAERPPVLAAAVVRPVHQQAQPVALVAALGRMWPEMPAEESGEEGAAAAVAVPPAPLVPAV